MVQKNIHILYLDDDRAMARLVQKHLSRAGYNVEIAHDGNSGLSTFQNGAFDLVALDYRMPGHDGLEVIRRLNTRKDMPPIIMVTGSGDESIAVEAMKMGASDYIVKDVGGAYLDLLPTVIEQVLQKQSLEIERQAAIDTLQRRNTDLALLHDASRILNSTLDLSQVIEKLLRSATEIVNAESGVIWFWESDKKNRLVCKALLHNSDFSEPEGIYLLASEGIAGWVAENKMSEVINNFEKDPRFLPSISSATGIKPRNLIFVPILTRNVTLGILGVINKHQIDFDENDLFLVEMLASTAATAIENARLFTDVQRLSITDGLTELFSRRHFFTVAEQEFQRSVRYQHEFAMIMLDIDHFKDVNDKYGHPVGDMVLKTLATDLGKSLRQMDIVSRYGGEEFVALLPETDHATAEKIAERLRETVEGHVYKTEMGEFSITISLGVASYSKEIQNIDALLALVDNALYEAKAKGRNKVVSASINEI